MSIDVEYAIKKDIRNNPIVREIDLQQKREFQRTVGLVGVIVAMLLFSAWQHFEVVRHGYEIERDQQERAAEEQLNRQLRLEVETWKAPHVVERRAIQELHMAWPAGNDALVIERARTSTPSRTVVAEVR